MSRTFFIYYYSIIFQKFPRREPEDPGQGEEVVEGGVVPAGKPAHDRDPVHPDPAGDLGMSDAEAPAAAIIQFCVQSHGENTAAPSVAR